MESANSAFSETQAPVDTAPNQEKSLSSQWFIERFDDLLPRIQEEWPDLAKQTLEATRGSLDELVEIISIHSGKTTHGVIEKLEQLFGPTGFTTKDIAENLEPLEKQLEELLDELNKTIRPRIEKPVRQRPLLALGIATGLGVILGILLVGGKRS